MPAPCAGAGVILICGAFLIMAPSMFVRAAAWVHTRRSRLAPVINLRDEVSGR